MKKDRFKELLKKYKDVIPYLFFGVCTTAVNIIVYWICAHLFYTSVSAGTIIAWVVAVVFAYVTNRKWVFHSTVKGWKAIAKECAVFFGCRAATGVLDWVIMYVFADVLGLNDVLIKIISNIIVIILNYVASKLLIFRKKNRTDENNADENNTNEKNM